MVFIVWFECKTLSLSAFRILLENDEDRLLVVFNRGLILMTEVFTPAAFLYFETFIKVD